MFIIHSWHWNHPWSIRYIIMKFEWKETGNSWYYFAVKDGRVTGHVHEITHTKIWLAKIIMNHNNEKFLGQFISLEFARMAVENFWLQQSITLLEADF